MIGRFHCQTNALLCRINFKQYEKPEKEVPANSEVLKALLEQEANIGGGVAGMAELQEDRQSKEIKSLTHM